MYRFIALRMTNTVTIFTSLRETATACIASEEYQRLGTLTEEFQNIYQEEDFVLYDLRAQTKISCQANLQHHTRILTLFCLSTRTM